MKNTYHSLSSTCSCMCVWNINAHLLAPMNMHLGVYELSSLSVKTLFYCMHALSKHVTVRAAEKQS